MSMVRKAASAIIPATTEPAGDAIVTQDATLEADEPDTTVQLNPLRANSKGAALLALLQREEGRAFTR